MNSQTRLTIYYMVESDKNGLFTAWLHQLIHYFQLSIHPNHQDIWRNHDRSIFLDIQPLQHSSWVATRFSIQDFDTPHSDSWYKLRTQIEPIHQQIDSNWARGCSWIYWTKNLLEQDTTGLAVQFPHVPTSIPIQQETIDLDDGRLSRMVHLNDHPHAVNKVVYTFQATTHTLKRNTAEWFYHPSFGQAEAVWHRSIAAVQKWHEQQPECLQLMKDQSERLAVGEQPNSHNVWHLFKLLLEIESHLFDGIERYPALYESWLPSRPFASYKLALSRWERALDHVTAYQARLMQWQTMLSNI